MNGLISRGPFTAVAAAIALALCAASSASAATRYAEPLGNGPQASCPQADPCSIQDAVAGPAVSDGDLIRLLPGTFDLGGANVYPGDRVTIEGEPGQARPLVTSAGSTTFLFDAPSVGSIVRGVDFIANNPFGDALHVNPLGNVTLERVRVTATGGSIAGVLLGGTMTDSVVSFQGLAGGAAIISCCTSRPTTLRNVTAVSTPVSSIGLALYESYGVTHDVTVQNTILRAPLHGIRLDDDGTVGDDTLSARVAYSNYSSTSQDASADNMLSLGAGNQTQAPLFAGAADFRQLPGSPTIDAGLALNVSALDFDGQARLLGAAPDIGADEAADPASLVAIEAGKLKRRRSVSVTLRCPSVACAVSAAAKLILKAPRAAKSAAVITLPSAAASLPAGEARTLSFKLRKRVLPRLKAARKAKLSVAVTATAPLGFTGSATRTLRFRRK